MQNVTINTSHSVIDYNTAVLTTTPQ